MISKNGQNIFKFSQKCSKNLNYSDCCTVLGDPRVNIGILFLQMVRAQVISLVEGKFFTGLFLGFNSLKAQN